MWFQRPSTARPDLASSSSGGRKRFVVPIAPPALPNPDVLCNTVIDRHRVILPATGGISPLEAATDRSQLLDDDNAASFHGTITDGPCKASLPTNVALGDDILTFTAPPAAHLSGGSSCIAELWRSVAHFHADLFERHSNGPHHAMATMRNKNTSPHKPSSALQGLSRGIDTGLLAAQAAARKRSIEFRQQQQQFIGDGTVAMTGGAFSSVCADVEPDLLVAWEWSPPR